MKGFSVPRYSDTQNADSMWEQFFQQCLLFLAFRENFDVFLILNVAVENANYKVSKSISRPLLKSYGTAAIQFKTQLNFN